MKKLLIALLVLVVIGVALRVSRFSVPHLFWPQKDVASSEVHSPNLPAKVLIAARSSEFKDAVAAKVTAALAGDSSVYVKTIGMSRLKLENGKGYAAVVLLNTCMAWDMDRQVNAFLKRTTDAGRTIVVTTSGSGDWQPRRHGRDYDAVAAASEKSKADALAAQIVEKVKGLLARPAQAANR